MCLYLGRSKWNVAWKNIDDLMFLRTWTVEVEWMLVMDSCRTASSCRWTTEEGKVENLRYRGLVQSPQKVSLLPGDDSGRKSPFPLTMMHDKRHPVIVTRRL